MDHSSLRQLPAVLLVKIFDYISFHERGKLYCLSKGLTKFLKTNEKFKIWGIEIENVKASAHKALRIIETTPIAHNKLHQSSTAFWFDKEGEVIMYKDLLGHPHQVLWIYKNTFSFFREEEFLQEPLGYSTSETGILNRAGKPDFRLNLSPRKNNQQTSFTPFVPPIHIRGSQFKKSSLYFFLSLLYKKYSVVILRS